MKKCTSMPLSALLVGMLTILSARAATLIVQDDFNVTASGTGFNLNTGVNRGINPPTATRLTGSIAMQVRYLKSLTRNANLHYITNNSALGISYGGNNTIVALSPDLSGGTTVYDFGPVLKADIATPALPSVYEVGIDITAFSNQVTRTSFGISSGADWGLPQTWDFGIELSQNASTLNTYTVTGRINGGSRGSTDVTFTLAESVGTFGQPASFLFRVADAGPQSGGAFNSHLELGLIEAGSTNWIYDTRNDGSLPSGWRFSGTARKMYMFVAGNSGPAIFDNYSVTLISSPPDVGVRAWTGGGGDDNWSTAANWDTGVPGYDALIFAGSSRQNNVNDLTGVTAPWIAFANGGFVLQGQALILRNSVTNSSGVNAIGLPIDITGPGIKTWSVAADSELRLTAPATCVVDGDHHLTGGGTLRILNDFGSSGDPNFEVHEGKLIIDGTAYTAASGGIRLGSDAAASGESEVVITNGGYLVLNGTGANLRVGDSARAPLNRVTIHNSTVQMAGASLYLPYATGATGEVVQVGGSLANAIIEFSRQEGKGSYTIRDGTLSPKQIKKTVATGEARMSFDNAVLSTAASPQSAFFYGLDSAEILNGGLTLDIQSDVVIAQSLSGVGGLKKTGSQSATLTGTNTFTGPVIVEGGKLVLQAEAAYSSIEVKDLTSLEVSLPAANTTLSASGMLKLGNSTLNFPLGSLANPSIAPITAVSLVMNGAVTIDIAGGSGLDVGQFPLIDYSGAISGVGSFSLGALPGGLDAVLVTNSANSSIDLLINKAPGLNWKGNVNANWDIDATANWVNALDGSAATYSDNQNTRFKDGALRGDVSLTTAVSPPVVTISNDEMPYVLNGYGPIYTTTMVKLGTNSVTRLDGTGDFIYELALNSGSYVISNSADANFASKLTDATLGEGTLVKDDTTTLTLTDDSSTYNGSFLVKSGILRLGAAGNLGAAPGVLTIMNGATLDVNNTQAPHKPVIVSGAGVNGLGAIVNNTTGGGVQNNLTDVTMVGDTVFGSVTGTRWDIRVRNGTGPGPGLRANGYNITKVGGGSLSISAQRHAYGGQPVPYWEMNIGDILVSEGNIAFEESTSLGNPEKSLVLMPGTSMNFFDLGITNPIIRNITATDASLTSGGPGHTNILNGSILMTGVISIRPNGSYYIFNGQMSGDSEVRIGHNGTNGYVILNGANTYTGSTTVTNSTLAGTGSLAGSLVVSGGGSFAPGVGVGTFTVTGDATLGGTSRFELAPEQVQNSDRLSAGGAINASGALIVSLATGASAPQYGDVFQLFNKGVSGAFAPLTLPALSSGLKWDTSDLPLNGSIRVTITSVPKIATVTASDGTFTFSGTGGVQGATYYVVASTAVDAPMSSWVPVYTNTFGAGGTFNFSAATSAEAELFFRLQMR
jgi:autotransporter-associated beta strand protein